MIATEQYFQSLERRLLEDFNRIRATNKDSDVKGGKNEHIVADFITRHYQAGFVVRNVEIIDSYDRHSQEIDVCVCNADQPIRVESGEIVIAEGVDFVVQVKAQLNSAEIERIVTNCSSIKQLHRKFEADDQIYGSKNDREFFVDRIPYLVFAFSANMRLPTLWKKLKDRFDTIPLEQQPDAIVVLNQGCIYNFRRGDGKGLAVASDEGRALGRAVGLCCIETGENTLAHFMHYVHFKIPRIIRSVSPLTFYGSEHWFGNMHGQTSTGLSIQPKSSKPQK